MGISSNRNDAWFEIKCLPDGGVSITVWECGGRKVSDRYSRATANFKATDLHGDVETFKALITTLEAAAPSA